MVFGPYDSTFGQGQHTAQFWLMVDNNSGTDVVATIDVVSNYGSNNLAQRLIRRNEFVAANQWQVFTLEFNNPCFGLVESRVWWSGTVNMKFSQVTITATNTSAVDFEWLVADHLGTPRMVVNKSGSREGVKRHDYLPFGEELYAGVSSRTVEHGYTGDGVRQKFTSYERDNETGLDYAQARYYSSIQGRFTSIDPYNIIIEVQASVDSSAQKARTKLIAYLGQPQQWNRYGYAINNPLKYIDPTGEKAWLTGSEEEQKAALERLKKMLGPELFKYVKTEVMDTHVGRVTVVSYDSKSNGDALARLGGAFGVYMAQILESTRVTEFRIATTFSDNSGRHTTREFGGAATVGAEESLTGNTQIFVHPDAATITQEQMSSLLGRSKSSDGKPLDFFNDIVDAHEFGHAFANMIYKVSVNSELSEESSLRFENLIRARRELPNRRRAH